MIWTYLKTIKEFETEIDRILRRARVLRVRVYKFVRRTCTMKRFQNNYPKIIQEFDTTTVHRTTVTVHSTYFEVGLRTTTTTVRAVQEYHLYLLLVVVVVVALILLL